MVTLSWCLIWQIISFILQPNEYSCLYAWTRLRSEPAIDLQWMPILAKKWWSSYWSWGVCKQAELSHLGHRKPARIHWKADALKTRHCFVRILVQRHDWVNILRKWAKRGRYSQWRSLLRHVERIFVHKNWREEYCQHLVSKGRRYLSHSSMFCVLFWKIALSAAELMSFAHLGAKIWHCFPVICGVPSKISVTPKVDAPKTRNCLVGILVRFVIG